MMVLDGYRKCRGQASNVYIYNNAYYNKRGSGGVCMALAAASVYVKITAWG